LETLKETGDLDEEFVEYIYERNQKIIDE